MSPVLVQHVPTSQQISIQFDRIDQTAMIGIRRAAVFLGLGVNAANDPSLNDYLLTQETSVEILPNTVSAEVLKGWKRHFRNWIVCGGFRELVDQLCIYFDQIHYACDLVSRSHTPARKKAFERQGLDGKLTALEQHFGIAIANGPLLASFYPVRNCFAHRLGRVGPEDLQKGPTLDLRYRRLGLVSIDAGQETPLPDLSAPGAPPVQLKAGQEIGVHFPEERLQFRLNQMVELTPKHLTDVLLFSHFCVKAMNAEVIEFAKARGVLRVTQTDIAKADVAVPQSQSPENAV